VVFADFLVIGKEQEATYFRLDCLCDSNMSDSYIHASCCTCIDTVFTFICGRNTKKNTR